jgi:hypothetical protein
VKDLLVFAASAGYTGIAALWMRHLYGVWRAKSIEEHDMGWFERVDRGPITAAAAFVGLLWFVSIPVTVVWRGLGWWLATTKVKTRAELREEREEMERKLAANRFRIAELERELRIGDDSV